MIFSTAYFMRSILYSTFYVIKLDSTCSTVFLFNFLNKLWNTKFGKDLQVLLWR